MKRIISAVMVCLMLALMLASCGGDPAAQINVNVKVTIDGEDGALIEGAVAVDEGSSVLDVIEKLCADNNTDIAYDDGFTAVEGIGDYLLTKNEDGTIYYWYFEINGDEVVGTADTITLSDGDSLEYIYTLSDTNLVTFRAIVDDEVVIEEQVLEGVLEDIISIACDSYELSDDGKTVEDIGDWESKDGYIWKYTVNGKTPKNPNVAKDEIRGGSVVEFKYVVSED